MNTETYEEKNINLKDLVNFRFYSSQTYEGERLKQMMDSIGRNGLISAIIVRPIANNKYEIICGHNRVKAMEALGRDFIRANVRKGLSDTDATDLFFSSNLNQQSFADWNYSHKMEAIKYYDALIKNHSQQGKRSDLIEKINTEAENQTCVYTRHKSDNKSRRSTARDKMACQLGISTATFSKYRSIIKLPDDTVKSIAQLLDNKTITFEAAYLISKLNEEQRNDILTYAVKNKESKKIKIDKLRQLSKPKRKGFIKIRITTGECFELRKKRTRMVKVRS